MSLRKDIDKIINSSSSKCRGMLIIQYLDDKGLSIDGNGWLDDDTEAQEQLDSDEIIAELENIFSQEVEKKLSPSTVHYLDDILDVFNSIDIEHIVYENKEWGPHFYSPDQRFNTSLSNIDINRELVMAIQKKALIEFDLNEKKTGKFTIASGKEIIVSMDDDEGMKKFHFKLNKEC